MLKPFSESLWWKWVNCQEGMTKCSSRNNVNTSTFVVSIIHKYWFIQDFTLSFCNNLDKVDTQPECLLAAYFSLWSPTRPVHLLIKPALSWNGWQVTAGQVHYRVNGGTDGPCSHSYFICRSVRPITVTIFSFTAEGTLGRHGKHFHGSTLYFLFF